MYGEIGMYVNLCCEVALLCCEKSLQHISSMNCAILPMTSSNIHPGFQDIENCYKESD